MKFVLLAAVAAMTTAAVPALAQDGSAPSDGISFTGPRGEIFGGWDRVGTRTRFDDGETTATDRGHKTGWTAGALVGYDMPVGNRFIVGAFGSYALSTARQCSQTDTLSGCLKSGREIEGGARVGRKIGDRTLLYLKGAYVNGQIRGKFTDNLVTTSGHANRDGWRAGAGVEFALNKHAYVKAEYDYTRFKSFDAADLGVTDTSLRFDRNQVVGGFGIRF